MIVCPWLATKAQALSKLVAIGALVLIAFGCKGSETAPQLSSELPKPDASAIEATNEPSSRSVAAEEGGLFIYALHDELTVLKDIDECEGVELAVEGNSFYDSPMSFARAADRAKLESCLAAQTVPKGKALVVGRDMSGWRSYLIDVTPALTPRHCVTVAPRGTVGILVEMTTEGKSVLAKFMEEQHRRRIAIVVGDVVEVAPMVISPITDGKFALHVEQRRDALLEMTWCDFKGEWRPSIRLFGSQN